MDNEALGSLEAGAQLSNDIIGQVVAETKNADGTKKAISPR